MTDKYQNSDKKQISLSNIFSDIHRPDLSEEIANLLLKGGVFFTSQIEQMTEYELSQIIGINSITAESIKRAFYQYRWRVNQNKKIQTIEELNSLIEKLPKKKEIMQTRIEDLFLHNNIYFAFRSMKLRTVGDILLLSEFDIFRIQGIGRVRYDEIIDSILNVIASLGEEIADFDNFPIQDSLDESLYTHYNLTFPEAFTMLLNTFTPRNREIFFEYYFTHRAKFGAYREIAEKYDLTGERIRQICAKGLRVLRHPRRINCITIYLNTVWKTEVQNFVIANGGHITRLELEQEFADDLPAIIFIQKEILQIKDIWAIVLLKGEQCYYLPDMNGEKV